MPGGRPRRRRHRGRTDPPGADATVRSRSTPTRRPTSGAPHAVAVARPRRPRQHGVGELDAGPSAQPREVRPGITQEVGAVDDRHVEVVAGPELRQLGLLQQPDVGRLAGLPGLDVGRHDLARFADQQHVAQPERPRQFGARSQVLGHLLGVEHVGGIRSRAEQRRHHGVERRLAGRDHLGSGRVVEPGPLQVLGVERSSPARW